MNNSAEYHEPAIIKARSHERKSLAIALILTGLLVCAIVSSFLIPSLSLMQTVLIDLILISVYTISLFFLLEPKVAREIGQRIIEAPEKTVYREVYIDNPVIKEVIVEKPVIKEVIKTVYVPEYRDVIRNVTKPVYIERKRKKLNIPKYKFLGSTQTKTYHLRSCKFSKLIKKKYKLRNNSKKYFTGKKFKACKSCLSRSKKINLKKR